jgi:hypothetical protein
MVGRCGSTRTRSIRTTIEASADGSSGRVATRRVVSGSLGGRVDGALPLPPCG